jgi:hypothetical protein
VYRSAGWPYQDLVEIELLAAGLLEQVVEPTGHTIVRLTEYGLKHVAQSADQNRQARTAHENLVELVARNMQREGRIVWTGLSLRARVTSTEGDGQWKWCLPDVFSIRNSSVEKYLEPVVHEIKVNRADLLGDLKRPEKRQAYLDVGGQCWYVLGLDAKGRPIGSDDSLIQASTASRVGCVISNWTGNDVFCCRTMARVETRSPWQMSLTRSFTKSQALSLLSSPRSNNASSRVLWFSCSRILMAQMSLSLRGDFWPIIFPLFHGILAVKAVAVSTMLS